MKGFRKEVVDELAVILRFLILTVKRKHCFQCLSCGKIAPHFDVFPHMLKKMLYFRSPVGLGRGQPLQLLIISVHELSPGLVKESP
jgi:hypothetical protein